MKRVVICVVLILSICAVSYAQEATLSPSVALSVPTATKIQIRNIQIDPMYKRMTVIYRWVDVAGNAIYKTDAGGTLDNAWTCQNVTAQPVADCTGPRVPYGCCTGVGTGTGCAVEDTSFSDIFGFTIRTQDVGQTLGKGMRALIINKMKAQIPALSAVTITFAD